jgi:hypothetical protein
MAFEIRKTNHVGAKNGGGAWCCRTVAKAESSRIRRRVDDLVAVSDGLANYWADERQVSRRPFRRPSRQLPFTER